MIEWLREGQLLCKGMRGQNPQKYSYTLPLQIGSRHLRCLSSERQFFLSSTKLLRESGVFPRLRLLSLSPCI